MNNFRQTANFIWEIADLLRGDYKQSDYGKVILPFTVLRRLDCVLSPTKQKVLDYLPRLESTKVQNVDPILNKVAKHNFHNRSKYDFELLVADADHLAANLRNYINGFSGNAREIIEYFDFDKQIDRLEKANLLYLVVKRFEEVDMHPDVMSNVEAGYLFEELIRKFSEISNETAGEHFTPREVIRLMVNLLFITDKDVLTQAGIVKTLYDPAGGTGGMLTVADEYVRELNPDSRLELFGQEINPESYAIFKADMLIKGQNASNVKYGNSFTEDGLEGHTFDYMLSNPPFGVSWKKVQKQIKKEHEDLGFAGRFGAGLPRVSDGSLLFLQHMMSKMKETEQGSRLAIVFNGSPLFTGSAGSGESEIRRWVIENDRLEAIIALPDQLFYNTGISTYIWVVDNNKRPERKGKVQLINAVGMFKKMSKSLGNKRNEISEEQIAEITRIYGDFEEGKYCKIFDNEDFGYSRITVERPERDENGEIITNRKGEPKPDSSLRDYENVPLKEDIEAYFEREVLPHVPDAWIDFDKTKVGYEVNFTRYFYEYTPLRPTSEIRKDIEELRAAMQGITEKAVN
ncbi:type I restriction-modification system subunit M [Phaeodactylibacter luteus]|uniref:site-specific DNA-methyltransferase (adenine-specific) n=1 Tax=Phaeodactylibacter luteus TaxID=1564516 RepID=A0A5C6RK47_9BACT|nr:class I SAM-dependent DNA methyltransferase [Phaeodactylibacter luteus]TXB61722.1 SAM-dependent DNA methyltransferase [Phaeodactylibacter luteus]